MWLSLESRNHHSLGIFWGLGGQWEGGREGGSHGKNSGTVNGSRVHVRERLKRTLVWLQPAAPDAFQGSERDSPAVSSSRLLGQQGPSSQGLSVVVLDLCGFLFVLQTPGFLGQSPDVLPLPG